MQPFKKPLNLNPTNNTNDPKTNKTHTHMYEMKEKNAHDGIIVTFFYNLVITFDHV